MDEREIQNILIEIIFSVVNEIENAPAVAEKITPNTLSSVYCLAKKHDLAHIVSKFIYQNKIDVGDDIKSQLQREELLSVYRHEQMKYAYEQICAVFDDAHIPYVPLKGSVLKQYYPDESMRTSCDIDILIHEGDLISAIDHLEQIGYRCVKKNYHDVSLYSPNKINLELHFNIQENMDNLDAVLKDAWEYTLPTGKSRHEFSKEFFAFHIFAHMAYHFISGGCGIRSLMDIWIMEHKIGITYPCAEDLLNKAGIYQFASEMSRIAEQCFTSNKRDDFSDDVLKYIFRGGVYGSTENKIAVKKSKNNTMVVYALKRLFLPYKSMAISFPILKKLPFLLPLCWVIRCIEKIVNGKTKKAMSELSIANDVTVIKLEEIRHIRSRLGL